MSEPMAPVRPAMLQPPADPMHVCIKAALSDGRPHVLRKRARMLVQMGEAERAGKWLERSIRMERETMAVSRLRAAVMLYLQLPEAEAEHVFQALIGARRLEARRTAWQVATAHPSPAMAEMVEAEVIRRGPLGMSPEVALAALANSLNDAYPLFRQALMAHNHPAYARALMGLNPEAASEDLLSYMAQEDAASVVAGQLDRVDRRTCRLALAHFLEHPPSLLHPAFRQVFYFAMSADEKLRQAALTLLASYAKRRDERFTALVAQQSSEFRQIFLAELDRRNVVEYDALRGYLRLALDAEKPAH